MGQVYPIHICLVDENRKVSDRFHGKPAASVIGTREDILGSLKLGKQGDLKAMHDIMRSKVFRISDLLDLNVLDESGRDWMYRGLVYGKYVGYSFPAGDTADKSLPIFGFNLDETGQNILCAPVL